jgi:tRNA U34 5-methylaminomethyl-2-thiouridine-forming methyltransferase MnmC
MKTELITTADGSHTLYLPEIDEHYHSTFGAIQESQHIFIDAGLKNCKNKTLTIFEVGFGTGLNALLTQIESERDNLQIHYITIEKYPLNKTIWQSLNYPLLQYQECASVFSKIHEAQFNATTSVSNHFQLQKIKGDFTQFEFTSLPGIDLIYFDAFSPDKQPEMWTKEIFSALFNCCNPGAIMATYCAKGIVRRSMQEAGFKTERLPGPPGKREMLRAIKPEI